MSAILVVGGGGREHAIVWAIRAAHPATRVLCVPGNPGIAAEGAECLDVSLDAMPEWAAGEQVSLAVIGPEAPLVGGLADRLRAQGIAVFGPSREAARLEGSKIDAKEFMLRAGVPTARFLASGSAADARRAVRV